MLSNSMGMIGQPSILVKEVDPMGLDDTRVGVIKEAHDRVTTNNKGIEKTFASFLNVSWKYSLLNVLLQTNKKTIAKKKSKPTPTSLGKSDS